ncbi:imidazole glycerol phosphate synthase subunit HisH [candidate division FCPU426 bacterium]|nr:imidazole glycerol phosphate synthase subunit HisH [candidate division FCPU426 bacterium]
MVAIVDYHMGNLHSVQKACTVAGLKSTFVSRAKEIRRAKAVILPGVGAFGHAMRHLQRQHLVGVLKEAAFSGKPFLGICLGMQLLFETSEEFGKHRGLGVFPGRVRPFPKHLKIPHMGWNSLSLKGRHPLMQGLVDGTYMYFVHSFYCEPKDPKILLATTAYGIEVAAAVGSKNICALQFHPEKSQTCGLKIYHNLARLLARKERDYARISSH